MICTSLNLTWWDRRFRLSTALACILLLSSCTTPKKEFFVAFSQCNNAEPYRAAQNALMTKLFAEAGGVRLVIADGQQDNSRQGRAGGNFHSPET